MSFPPSSSHTPTPTPTSIPTPLLSSSATEPHTTTTTSSSTQTPTATQAATSTSTSSLKAAQRDRQARNKSPKSGEAVWCGNDGGAGEGNEKEVREEKVSYTDDSYEAVERRRWAATILDCPELLMMHAQARQDTIPSTRLHFMKLLCGYEDSPRKTKKAKARRSGRGVKE